MPALSQRHNVLRPQFRGRGRWGQAASVPSVDSYGNALTSELAPNSRQLVVGSLNLRQYSGATYVATKIPVVGVYWSNSNKHSVNGMHMIAAHTTGNKNTLDITANEFQVGIQRGWIIVYIDGSNTTGSAYTPISVFGAGQTSVLDPGSPNISFSAGWYFINPTFPGAPANPDDVAAFQWGMQQLSQQVATQPGPAMSQSVVQRAPPPPVVPAATNKTWLYVALGAVVLGGGYLVLK